MTTAAAVGSAGATDDGGGAAASLLTLEARSAALKLGVAARLTISLPRIDATTVSPGDAAELRLAVSEATVAVAEASTVAVLSACEAEWLRAACDDTSTASSSSASSLPMLCLKIDSKDGEAAALN